MASTGEVWRLGRRPALDGLRGIAVLLVVVGHAFPRFAAAGVVGVTVFFTLSGFLITALLLEEHDRHGRVDLRAFYVRRARRLLPALFVFLTVMLAAGLLLGPALATPREVLDAVFYVENLGPTATGVGHTWSLSVEEQFYLLFPLIALAALRRGRRQLAWLLVAGVLLSAAGRWLLWDPADPGRVYHGTDTNAGALLLGCLLAVLMFRARVRKAPAGLVMAGVAVLALLSCVPDGVFVRQWLAVLVSLVAAVVIWATTTGGYSGRLSSGWLTLVGRRSYALYLWHFPLLYVVSPRLHVPWWAVLLLAAASWGLALLSWRYVEEPLLRTPVPNPPQRRARQDRTIGARRPANRADSEGPVRSQVGGLNHVVVRP